MIPIPEFLRAAPDSVRRDYAEQAQAFTLPAGKQILFPGQPCAAMAFVVTGCVRVYLLGHDGREITLYRVERGHGCVLTASCILGGAGFPASAVVETDASGAGVAADLFRDWVIRYPFWRDYVFHLIGERIAAVLARFEEAAFLSIDTRLALYVLEQSTPAESRIATTQQKIANDLGTAREVVSRALNRWQEQGWVSLHRGEIHLLRRADVERLAHGA
jgi:CRP/FNR family transcriptional regulator